MMMGGEAEGTVQQAPEFPERLAVVTSVMTYALLASGVLATCLALF